MSRSINTSLWLIAILFVSTVSAQEKPDCPITLKSKYLQPLAAAASGFVNMSLCDNGKPEEVEIAYVDFLTSTAGWFDRFGGFQREASPIDYIESVISLTSNRSVAVAMSANDGLLIEGKEFMPADPEQCKRVADVEWCAEVLDEFVSIYSAAHQEYVFKETPPVGTEIDKLRKEWEPFLEAMRSQTIIERVVNGWWYKRNETSDFEPPPRMQWILLHPIALVEYVDDAGDGDKANEAIGVEILGANWWLQDKWYVPSGGSLLALYSDREGVEDWGYGVAVHFKSVYTIGYANHSGDDGVFLSVDLLKAFHDKRKTFDAYLGD